MNPVVGQKATTMKTASLADIYWPFGDETVRSPNNVFAINKYGTPRTALDSFMTGTSQVDGAENYNNIDHIKLTKRIYGVNVLS